MCGWWSSGVPAKPFALGEICGRLASYKRPGGEEPIDIAQLFHQIEVTYDLARTIVANAPLALAGIKATIQRTLALREQIVHDDVDELVARARRSADAREGVQAMLEKRLPVFRGE
jgi:hypothetical protein